jgi:squalene-hopene/tetraprenyl-beta-curcumene cyclase
LTGRTDGGQIPTMSRALPVALILSTGALVAALAGGRPAAVAAAGAADAWDPAAAARYLDARMDVWWAKAKPLRTGTSETKCLSCHTAVPYLLARPALRRAMGVAEPTSHEARVLETVQKRVENVADQALYYEHTDAKKKESLGVEAVFNAWLLTTRDTLGRSSQPSDLTRTAMARLWAVQRPDGAWDWLDFGLEPYETTDAVYHGATLAAMAAGTVPGKGASTDAVATAGIERLRAYLHDNFAAQRRFNKAWALLASAGFTGMLSAEERAVTQRDLESAQRTDGGWSLADLGGWRWSKAAAPFAAPGQIDRALIDRSDAYATGLVVYALRHSGRSADHPAVARGMAWLREHQAPERAGDASWAPWRAHSLNFDREHGGDKGEPWRRMFMSDLATAFAVLALVG